MTVRKMKAEDIPAVSALLKHTFVHPWSENVLISQLEKPDSVESVALMEDEIVGFLSFEKILDEGSVELIAVSQAHRRQGIARMLLDQMFSSFDDLHTVFLEVRASNTPAIALYESMGFETVSVRKNYYAEIHEDALVMKKEREAEGKPIRPFPKGL